MPFRLSAVDIESHMSRVWIVLLFALFLSGCSTQTQQDGERAVLRVAVSTSTRDSGLLDQLVPVFEKDANARVDVIAVGTGAALKLGQAGDVDIVIVHARPAEDAFMRAGHGVRREDLMSNSFQLLGPKNDPAEIRGVKDPVTALQRIALQKAKFVSRGDESGTHQRERKLWNEAGGLPKYSGYVESGQGMGATLTMADQMSAYVLCDRGTYLKLRRRIGLVPLVSGSAKLRNPYGILVVNPKTHSNVNAPLANRFVDFMISPKAQQIIRNYKIDGETLFVPAQVSKTE